MSTPYSKTTFIDGGPPSVNAAWLNAQGTYLDAIASGSGSVAKADSATLADTATLAKKANIWNSATAYSADDFVTRNGKMYVSLTSNTNIDPATDSGSNWSLFKSGSSGGGISYVSNPDFESLPGTTGWNTYNDGSVASPVDGTDGSAAITLAKNTTSPLFGLADMVMTKGASNVQGQGFSTDFTIDPGATGQPLSLTFSYKASSNYADNDIGVYLYDVTNAIFIPISVRDIPKAGGSITAFLATFIPSWSLSYRLIFHVQSTSALAYTFEIDNVSVSVQKALIGAVISNETSYTPAITGAGTPTILACRYQRIGNRLNGFIKFTAGTATAVEARLSLPVGLTIDSGVPTIELVGFGGTNAASNYLHNVLAEPSVAYITFGASVNGNTDLAKANGSALWASGQAYSYYFDVPIAQWTSNVNLATDFTEYASNYSSSDADDSTSFVYGPGGSIGVIGVTALSQTRRKRIRFIRPIQINDVLIFEYFNPTTALWQATDVISGGSVLCNHYVYNNTSGGIMMAIVNSTDVDVAFGTTPSGNSTATWNAATWSGYKWRVRKVSNGNMAEQPPVVRAEYSNQVITSAGAPCNYSTKVEDTHNAVTVGAAWKFTVPIAGVYHIEGAVLGSSATVNSIFLYKNGSQYRLLGQTTAATHFPVSATVRLNAGDYIAIYSGLYGFSASANDFVSITRIGG